MAKKKKTNRKTTPPLRLSSKEEEQLKTILEDQSKITPDNIKDHISGPEFAQALLERLPLDDPATLGLTLRLRDAFGEKIVQKSVNKLIFKLRQKGVIIPEQDSPKETPLIWKQPSAPEPEAYLGPIDGTGSRGILLIIPRIPKGVDVGIGLVSSNEGISYFIFDHYSKKRSREIQDLFFEQAGKTVKTSISHAAAIMERSYNRTEIKTEESPGDYLKLRPWILENITVPERPAIYDHIHPEDKSDEILTVSQINKLLDHELMEPWILEHDKIQPVMDQLADIKESPIIISDAQKANRAREIHEKAVRELFPEGKRVIIKEDLEEMAYLFFKHGEEDYARLCLSAASTLDEKDSHFKGNPFLEVFLGRSLDYYFDIMEENRGAKDLVKTLPPSLITT